MVPGIRGRQWQVHRLSILNGNCSGARLPAAMSSRAGIRKMHSAYVSQKGRLTTRQSGTCRWICDCVPMLTRTDNPPSLWSQSRHQIGLQVVRWADAVQSRSVNRHQLNGLISCAHRRATGGLPSNLLPDCLDLTTSEKINWLIQL